MSELVLTGRHGSRRELTAAPNKSSKFSLLKKKKKVRIIHGSNRMSL